MTSNDLFSLLNTELTLPAATSAAAAVFPGPQECHPYPDWGWRKKEWRKERKGAILVFVWKAANKNLSCQKQVHFIQI
jgi:hypothetical protein